ncbi:tetratricopeptide repeat protein [Clostridium sp. SHJSY1]|uniref:tetratricopeptide repeat protein n=1 Tax=Clostridium sp. SHJSY1 TaxID=2942483 RepID=UPI002874BBDE|nr:tetratricopeptide repeat protein [Clostridium sp. SHJSY1]MDS0527207.1 tetratricopeptide repeat protein [Clostridium sp. SHJSY1]
MKNKQKDKAYMKAIRFYEDGELNKALKKCDESISSNLKNAATLNLKGLILYIKGDLEGAKAQWKINSEHNDDIIAKHYIHDSKSDIKRLQLYKLGEGYLKQLKVEDAIGALNECAESDFNSIKVNLALAICYLRKGDYTTSSVYTTKVLKTDKNNQTAKNIAKELKSIGDIELEIHKENNWIKPIMYILIATSIVVGIVIGMKIILNNVNSNSETIDNNKIEEEIKLNKDQESPKETNESNEKGETKTENLVDFNALELAISNKDFEIIYNGVKKINENDLKGKEKTIYFNGKELLKNEGVSFFYKKGSEFYNQNLFNEAKNEFQKGYEFGEGNYIYPHIIFFKASADEKLGNVDGAISGYEEFYNKFKTETYIEETIYKLALLYKDRDIDKSIMYAKEIRERYPSSIYNNKIISNLLDNK